MDQPGKVLPCSWSAEQGNCFFPYPRSRLRIGLARRVRPSHPASAHSFSTLRLNHQSGPNSRDSSRFPRRRPILHRQPPSEQSRFSGHAIAYRWRSLPRVRWPKVSSPQGSSRNECSLFRHHNGPIIMRLSFFHTHFCYVVDMYGHTYSKSMDQPGKVANPARVQLNRKNEDFPVRVRA